MADSVSVVNKVRILTGGVVSEADIGAKASNIILDDGTTLQDTIDSGNIIKIETDDVYVTKNDDGQVTLNNEKIGVRVGTNETTNLPNVVTLDNIIGVKGNEQITNFNTMQGIAPESHASRLGSYGIGTKEKYGHVKVVNSSSDLPSDTSGVALGAGFITEIAKMGFTVITESNYDALSYATKTTNNVLYYVCTSNDLKAIMSDLCSYYHNKTAGTKEIWDAYFADEDGGIAHDAINLWWNTDDISDAYKTLIFDETATYHSCLEYSRDDAL